MNKPLDPHAADAYALWDAAYVLGALSPAERMEFEEHLAGCPDCRAEVAALAGLPGLLAQVPPVDALELQHIGEPHSGESPDEEPMPIFTPPSEAVATPLRRPRRVLTAIAAVIALLVGGVGGYLIHDLAPFNAAPAGPVSTPFRLGFSAVVPSGMTAVVDVVPSSTGTEFNVECQYAREATTGGAWDKYAIYVIDKSGVSTNLKEWTARPDKVMTPSGNSTLPVASVRSVEIRSVESGETLMVANLVA